jgi:hypothetical protein
LARHAFGAALKASARWGQKASNPGFSRDSMALRRLEKSAASTGFVDMDQFKLKVNTKFAALL